MKKILVTLALLGAVSYTFGQGQVTFNNSATTLISTNTAPANHPGAWTGPATGPVNPYSGTDASRLKFFYGLFSAPQGTLDVNAFAFTGAIATNTTAVSGGRLTGGQPAVPGYAIGSTAALLVRGWSSNIGTTWSDVQVWLANDAKVTGWYGTSAIANVALGGGSVPINGLFGAAVGTQIPGFVLNQVNPIPEPTSFALAGLGAAALLIFRRRK